MFINSARTSTAQYQQFHQLNLGLVGLKGAKSDEIVMFVYLPKDGHQTMLKRDILDCSHFVVDDQKYKEFMVTVENSF